MSVPGLKYRTCILTELDW